tara:strand:+ start:984 stop:1733 length:750 start_codon:yes stop_codon:yes gene_type:complete
MVGAIIGGLTGVASAAYSFYQADQEAKAAAEAQRQQARLRQDARKRAEVNYFEGLTLPMEAYEQAFENTLASSQTQVEALQEADPRALAAGIGRVGAIATQRDAQTRTTMAEDLFNLDKMKAQSRDAINQQLLAMDVAEKREMAQRERDAERLKAQQVQAGITGVTSAAKGIDALIPLFTSSKADRQAFDTAKKLVGQPGFEDKTLGEMVDIVSTANEKGGKDFDFEETYDTNISAIQDIGMQFGLGQL